MPLYKTRMRVLRAELEWSQAKLAGQVGVTRQTINSIEKARFHPNLRLAFKIARALVDLFRRTKDRRQFLVSTHDARFGGLLSRKLRPRDQSGRTLVIEMHTWNRVGPTVVMRDVNCDPVRLRLVS